MKLTTTLIGILSVITTAYAQFPGCPSVNAGADQTLTCNQPCATLTATPFHAGATNTYSVASIPHTPPIAYNQAGGTGVSVGTDDVWSPQITLPFTFCYYGQSYTSCKIGSNGSIKFGTYAPTTQPWSFTASCPSTSLTAAGDIFGIYHDIDPSYGGTVKWYVVGTAPCRIFVVSYNGLPHYSTSCNGSVFSTFMMVLYETTNVIDVYVNNKGLCSSWNGGAAIIGIQNPAGTSGIAAPNRNTSPTWTVSTPEGWRFTPNGAPIYTTEWFQGATSVGTGNTVNVCPTVATTYTATTTYTACDGTVIVKTDNVLVTPDPGIPSGNQIASTPPSCSSSTGSFEVQGTGGAGSYQYSIDNGVSWQPGGVFNNLASGNYTVLVQDVNGCQGSISATVGPSSTIDLTLASTMDVSCNGGSNGSAVTAVSGGQAPYSYTLNGGSTQSGGTYSNLAAGTYTIEVTDANGCTDTQPVTITQPAAVTISFVSATAANCSASDGSLTMSGSGGTGTLHYSSNGGTSQTSPTFNNVAGGTYTIQVVDDNGCSASMPATVGMVNNLTALLIDNQDASCNGLSDGSAQLGGTGTPLPYTYSLVGGTYQGSNTFTSLAAGTYNYVVADVNNCRDTISVTIAQPTPVNVTTNTPLTMCAGASVVMNAQATGGNGSYVFSWSNSLPNGPSNTVSPATTTNYTVTATDVNGCTANSIIQVTVNPAPLVNAGNDQAICIGSSVVLSGSGVQSYTWNNGVTNGVSFTPASTQTYTVTGTAANGCQGTDQVVVTVNPLPVVDAGAPQTVCQGSPVTLNGSGATSYTWNNGVTNGVAFTPSATQTYTVTGTNANGCTNTDQVTITVNTAVPVNAGIDQSVCQGGSVTLTATGTQTYSWNNGVTNGVSFIPGSTQTYTVTGTDANGCQSTDQVVVTINPLPNVNAGADQTICIGSPVTLSGSGAQTYVWNNGVTNGVSFTPGSTQTYTVTGTDINGCVNTDQVTVTIVTYPAASVSADVTEGFPALTVNFDNNSTNASTYHWNFGDGSQWNVSSTAGQQHEYANPGDYIVILTASNGSCSDTDTVLITVNPLPDPIIVVPNIFTPNGDHNNDTFFITASYVKSVRVQIVNRWGDRMYDYDNVQGYWDGTVNGNLASDGVYFFTYVIEGLNGTILSGQGNIQLAR
ncbi:gliding motility-associated C-terminal domain-containing protein [Fluviicola sp.]|uniref:T9SS type B sorting domain-containing protein n=1 Tax=Fluviicola sp. TaxID=1917219 RepID=UPI0031CEE2A9